MVNTLRTIASFAVDDLPAAKSFYGDTLGLRVSEQGPAGPLWLHSNGDDHLTMVYVKPHHVPAEFTVLNLAVDDIEAAVDDLVDKGVTIERYDGIPADGRGIHRGEGRALAWFTDPAGNVLSVVQLG